jgi:hypothetical protein
VPPKRRGSRGGGGIAPHGDPTYRKPMSRHRLPFHFDLKRLGFVHSASASINLLRATVLRIGLALVGGDFTGDHRGDWSVDLQGERTDPTQVASGLSSVAFGNENTASGAASFAIGVANVASGLDSFALGVTAYALADHAMAFGTSAFAGALKANAIGYGANARVAGTTVLCGPLCGQKGDSILAADWFNMLAGAEVIIRLGWIDALAAAADYTLTLPAGCRFWVHDMGIIVSDFTGLTVQPWIRFGIPPVTPQKYVANVQTTNLTAQGKCQVFQPLVTGDGEVALTFGIVTPATATKLKLSPYWRGMLMESD